MSTSADSPDLALSARIKQGFALQAGSELQITYDGTTPPLALLRELTELGWEHAVPAPPPAAAIDWSRPDPVTGTRHSVRPFQALTTATISGSDDARAAAIEAARAVLERYGALRDGPPVAAPDPAPPERLDDGPVTQDVGAVRVALVVDDREATQVHHALARLATVCADRPDVWSTATTYRGQRTEEVHEVRRLDLRVAEADYAELMSELARFRVRAVERLA